MFFIFTRLGTITKELIHQLRIRIVERKSIDIHNMVNFVLYGMLYDAMLNFYKPFAIKFLQRIGGNDLHFSLFNSLPGLFAACALIPGLLFIDKSKNKKRVTSVIFSLSRMMILFMILTVYFPKEYQPIVFVLFLSLTNFYDAIGQSSLQSYLGDLFTPHKRADAISLRNKFGNVSIMVVTLLSGIILTLPKTDAQRITAYQCFFFLAFLCGIGEIFVFNRFKDPVRHTDGSEPADIAVKSNMKKVFSQIFSNKDFITYSALTLFFYFTFHMGWPLFNIYYITFLNATEFNIAISSTLGVVPIVLSSKWWGRQIMKNGTYKTTAYAIFGVAFSCFLLGSAPNVTTYIFFSIISGFFTGGVTNCLLAGLLENSGNKNRVMYIGVYNTFMNLSLGFSPLVAHMILTKIGLTPAIYVVASLRFTAGILMFLYYKRVTLKAS